MNDENQAWRMIGLAARLCIELGLHQANSLHRIYHSSKTATRALTIFWDIYILDRRFSLSTGRPFAIQDTDIDPALPKPVSNPRLASQPYITLAFVYCCSLSIHSMLCLTPLTYKRITYHRMFAT